MIRPDEAIERLRAANAVPSLHEFDPAELAAVTALLEERKSAMTIQIDEQAHPEISHSTRSRRPAMAFVMAFVIVALVGGVVVLASNGGGDEVVVAATSTPPPTTIPAAPIDLVWEQVPPPEGWGGGDWIVVEDRLFGLGWTGCPDVETPVGGDSCNRAAVWTWSEGPWSEASWPPGSEGWSRVMVDEEFIPQSDEGWTSLESITYVNGRYMAVGFIQLLGGDTWGPRGPTRVWTSPDGITWTRVQEGPGDGLATMASGSRLVVVTGGSDGLGEPSTIWVSEDGSDWTAAFRAAPSSEIRDVVEGGSGFVAVGEACDGETSCGAAVWASDGGASWRQVWSSPGDTMTEVMWVGGRYFAFGRTPGHTAVWTSRQGTDWALVAEFPASGSRGFIPTALVQVDGGFLLACATDWDSWWDGDSQTYPNGDPGPSSLWTSADGTEWTQISDPHGVFARSEITDLIPLAEGVLALGIQDMREEANDGSYPIRGAMWASRDGVSWAQAQLEGDPLGEDGPVLGMTTLFETRILITAEGQNVSPVVLWASSP